MSDWYSHHCHLTWGAHYRFLSHLGVQDAMPIFLAVNLNFRVVCKEMKFVLMTIIIF